MLEKLRALKRGIWYNGNTMIVLLIFLFLLSRILHLLFYFPEPYTEELLRGTIAKELIEGLKIPFFDYAADHYSGGSLIYGALTVPLFLLLGKSVFTLRLTALFFQLGAFLTWYALMKRFFSQKAALYTALLYLFTPPWLTHSAMYAVGVHAESLFFTALGLLFLFRLLYDKRTPVRDAACLGLVTGFGTYFSYQCAVSLICFLLFWFYEDRSFLRKKEFLYFILSFLIGFSPWFVYNSLYHFSGVDRVREVFTYPGWERIFIIPFRFLKLATYKIIGMFSFNFRGGLGRHPYFPGHPYNPHITLLNLLYYVTLLFSYVTLFRFEKKNKKIHFLFLFPLLFLFLAATTRLRISTYGSRYLLPLFPFFFAVIALALIHLQKKAVLRKASVAIFVLVLAMGVEGGLNLLSPKEFKLSLGHQGYSYRQLGWALTSRYPKDLNQLSKLAKKVDAGLSGRERFFFHLGLSEMDARRIKKPEDLQKYLLWARSFDKAYQPFYLKEIGHAWGNIEGNLSEKIEGVAESLDKDEHPYLIQGLIGSLDRSRMRPEQMFEHALEWMKKLSLQNQRALAYSIGKQPLYHRSPDTNFLDKIIHPPEFKGRHRQELLSLYYRGVGAFITIFYEEPHLGYWPLFLIQGLGRIEEKWQDAVFWGAGFETPLLFEDPYEFKKLAESLPSRWRNVFEQGLLDRFAWKGQNRWIESY